MAVTAARPAPALLLEAVREDPNRGVDAIYQRLAGTRYRREQGFTFLTLAGGVALLAMAGSPGVVFLGMAVLTMLGIVTEAFARRALGDELVPAVVGVGMAFWIAQATFPRLLGAFFVELWITLLLLGWLTRRLRAVPAPNATVEPDTA